MTESSDEYPPSAWFYAIAPTILTAATGVGAGIWPIGDDPETSKMTRGALHRGYLVHTGSKRIVRIAAICVPPHRARQAKSRGSFDHICPMRRSARIRAQGPVLA